MSIILNNKKDLDIAEEDYEECRKKLLDKIGKLEINTQTVIAILKMAMEIVEATQLKGNAQKELCIKLVKDIFADELNNILKLNLQKYQHRHQLKIKNKFMLYVNIY